MPKLFSLRTAAGLAAALAIVFHDPAFAGKARKRPARGQAARLKTAATFDPAKANDPANTGPVREGSRGAAVIRAQVLLDRAGFSPGEIDGAWGDNLRRAVTAFQEARGIPVTGHVDGNTWSALNADTSPVLVPYTVAETDIAGPFEPVPADMIEKAKLKSLGYESAAEALGEKFHASPGLLQRMNPGKNFDKPGEEILVPNVASEVPGGAAGPRAVATVVVKDSTRTLQALDAEGKVLFSAPVSAGSEHDPLPVGQWKITGIARNPKFHYNPKLFWDADPADSKAVIAPGPNNPVGPVWIDISKPHYGIHGTPEPAHVGKTQSHGCIRLTNWDALRLAAMVKAGTALSFEK